MMYKDRLYKQIDGMTMGSPLGPTLANFFFEHLKEQFLPISPFACQNYT